MKLTDLSPKWYAEPGRQGQGIVFRCPVHPDGRCARPKIAVPLGQPLDGGRPLPGPTWDRTGDTFETLTLSPSINAMESDGKGGWVSHWHGWVRAGEIVGA